MPMHERNRINLEPALCISPGAGYEKRLRGHLKSLGVAGSIVVGSALLLLGCSELEMTELMARMGDADAQYELGLRYAFGEDVAEDKTEALKWWRKAAEQGNGFSQHNLGWMYDNGVGVAEDDVEAVKWYRKAAEQGVAWSQFSLGVAYRDGEGVARDSVLAHMWATLASAQGNEGARENLEIFVKEMTEAQIAESRKMAREWQRKHLSERN